MALAEVMVATTCGGKVPKPSVTRPEPTHVGSTDRDVGARGCPVSEKEGPSSEELAREGLSRGVQVRGTRSGRAKKAQP